MRASSGTWRLPALRCRQGTGGADFSLMACHGLPGCHVVDGNKKGVALARNSRARDAVVETAGPPLARVRFFNCKCHARTEVLDAKPIRWRGGARSRAKMRRACPHLVRCSNCSDE